MFAVQVESVWVGSAGSGAVEPGVRVWSYASTPPARNCAVRPVSVEGDSTTTVTWSGLPADAPAETTVKVSAVAAFAACDPAAIAPTAAMTASVAPRLARTVTSPNITVIQGITIMQVRTDKAEVINRAHSTTIWPTREGRRPRAAGSRWPPRR